MRARHGASAAAWVAGVLAAPGRGDDGEGSRGYSAPEGMSTSTGQYAPVSLPGEPAFLTEKPGRPQSAGPQRVGEGRSALCPQTQDYLCLRQLRPGEGWAWGWRGCLACGEKVCRDTDGLRPRSYAPSGSFFPDSCGWQSEGLFGRLSP